MEMQGKIREIKVTTSSNYVFNLVNHFIQHENYVFVGNESEIWLENLNHPKIQLIYLNDRERLDKNRINYLSQKVSLISVQIKKRFLVTQVSSLILNTTESLISDSDDEDEELMVINIPNPEKLVDNQVVNSLYPSIVDIDFDAPLDEIIAKLEEDSKKRALQSASLINLKKKPFTVYAFLVINALFFAYLWYQSRTMPSSFVVITYGSTYNPLIASGQWWRLITTSIMHIEPMHLLFNAVIIYRFGRLVESIFGHLRMAGIILLSAILASLFGFAFSTNFSIGASGVTYGLFGVLIFLAFEMRKTFMPLAKQMVLPLLGVSIVSSLMLPNIDHWGHLGGFIGGFLAAVIVGVPHYKPYITRSVLTAITTVVLISGLWIGGLRLTEDHDFSDTNRFLIVRNFYHGNPNRGLELIEKFNEHDFFESLFD